MIDIFWRCSLPRSLDVSHLHVTDIPMMEQWAAALEKPPEHFIVPPFGVAFL